MIDVFDQVRLAAQKSPTFNTTKYAHASAILTSKNKIISIGRNHFRGDIIDTEDGPIMKTVHSEIHALYQVNVRRLQGATIVNYACATGPYGGTVISRPCDNCWAILKKLSFRKVIYTIHSLSKLEPKWQEERFD